jgi:hypothetical protein
MYADVRESEKTCKHCTKRVPVWYGEPLNNLTVSFILPRVWMDVS